MGVYLLDVIHVLFNVLIFDVHTQEEDVMLDDGVRKYPVEM